VISCVDFIPAYSELFKFLERKGGEAAVRDFWSFLSDTYLKNLRDLVAAQGIKGCWLYWSQTLNEEAADFRMELDEAAGEFKIVMYRCPPRADSSRSSPSSPTAITACTAMPSTGACSSLSATITSSTSPGSTRPAARDRACSPPFLESPALL